MFDDSDFEFGFDSLCEVFQLDLLFVDSVAAFLSRIHELSNLFTLFVDEIHEFVNSFILFIRGGAHRILGI